ncbi:MAG TPA: dihydropteroate synthase [Thermaerobacter sp.]
MSGGWRVVPGGLAWGERRFAWGERTYVMGILNVTPDSFSDGGHYLDPERALEHALAMEEEGADIIDVGAESTRPGAAPVPAEEELRRLLPVLRRLAPRVRVPISVDTYKAEVARAALAEGAAMINDVGGLQKDPAMAAVAAKAGVPVVVMHSRPHGHTHYDDLWADVLGFLRRSLELAEAAGLPPEYVIVDPGFGFGKTAEHNLELLRGLHRLRTLGRPVLLGTSRKSTIGQVLNLPVSQRLEGTAATVVLAIPHGVDIVRVHDVAPIVRLVRMADAIVRHPHWEMPARAPGGLGAAGTDTPGGTGGAGQPVPAGPASAAGAGHPAASTRRPLAGPGFPDTIQLRGLRFRARHGVLPEEYEREQLFIVDLDLGLSVRAAGRADDLSLTVDYAEVFRRVGRIVRGPHRQLIETLAESVARDLLAAFPLEFVRVRVAKPEAPLPGALDHVAVEVWRSRDDL